MIHSATLTALRSDSTALPANRTHAERYRLDHLPDEALHAAVKTIVGRYNVTTADVLAHLAEARRVASTASVLVRRSTRIASTSSGFPKTKRCAEPKQHARRCCERAGLELHHEHAFALGGPTTIENLRLLCRSHNALLAERDFGRAHVERMRNGEATSADPSR
jgi:hypothetical protein